MNNNITPDAIKDLRKKLKLTQKQLAKICHVDSLTLGRWENGLHRPSPLALRQLKRLIKKVSLPPNNKSIKGKCINKL